MHYFDSSVLRQPGVSVVNRLYHVYPVAEALSLFPPMRGRRVAVVSEGGGPITVAADALVENGLELGEMMRRYGKPVIVQLHSQIAEIDLNPVIARADGYTIVDARMVFGSEPRSKAQRRAPG